MGREVTLDDLETATPAAPAARRRPALWRPRLYLAIIACLALGAFGWSWLSERAQFVITNDARLAADMIAVSSDVSGRVTETYARSGDAVSEGDLLYQVDDREAVHLLEEYLADEQALLAEIERERTRLGLVGSLSGTHIDESRANVISAEAAVEAAEAELAKAEREFARADNLLDAGLLTRSAWDDAENDLLMARQSLNAAKANLDSAKARAREAELSKDDASIVAQDLRVLEARLNQVRAKVERQRVIVDQHRIRSPIDGVVDEMFYDIGERTLQGFRVALLHDPGKVWVSANIKETEVEDIQKGARVRIRVDSAPDDDLAGRVTNIGDLTLAESAMMPNPNASGVFTKITQRIEVRIDLEATDVRLRPGSMVRVWIDRKDDLG